MRSLWTGGWGWGVCRGVFLFSSIIVRPLRGDLGRALLTVLGVTLGGRWGGRTGRRLLPAMAVCPVVFVCALQT